MAVRITQGMRIVQAYPMADGSGLGLLPRPGVKAFGSVSRSIGSRITVPGANFISNGVVVGDILSYPTAYGSAMVTEVISETEIGISVGSFVSPDTDVFIYAPVGGEGCNVFVAYGTPNSVAIKTIGGDTVNLYNVQGQSFIPIMITNMYQEFSDLFGVYVIQ